MEYEEIYFLAIDGVTLNGWFIPADSDKLIICIISHPETVTDFLAIWNRGRKGGGFEVNSLPRYKVLHDAGYNVLIL